MATSGAETMVMGGVVVKFPYKPYPPQKAMMSKVSMMITGALVVEELAQKVVFLLKHTIILHADNTSSEQW